MAAWIIPILMLYMTVRIVRNRWKIEGGFLIPPARLAIRIATTEAVGIFALITCLDECMRVVAELSPSFATALHHNEVAFGTTVMLSVLYIQLLNSPFPLIAPWGFTVGLWISLAMYGNIWIRVSHVDAGAMSLFLWAMASVGAMHILPVSWCQLLKHGPFGQDKIPVKRWR